MTDRRLVKHPVSKQYAWTDRDRAREAACRNRVGAERDRVSRCAYQPPPSVASHLGAIADLLAHATPLPGGREKETFLAFVRTSIAEFLYFETTKLDLDTDGNTDHWHGATPEVSHKFTNALGNADANVQPYFVLPLAGPDPDGPWLGKDHGIRLGDLGVILGRDKVVYAQFGDAGPFYKIGEASIAALRGFGPDADRLRVDGRGHGHLVNSGVDGPFATIVFPGSGSRHMKPADVASRAKALFVQMGGLP